MQTLGIYDDGIFFLRDESKTQSNIDLLMQNGFLGYTVYHEAPNSGQTKDGYVFFDYSYIRTGNTGASERMKQGYLKKSSFILVFDLKSMESGDLSDEDVTGILDKAYEYSQREDCSFSTVKEVVAELSSINAFEAEKQAEYDIKVAAIQARIKQIDQTLRDIYSEWNANNQ